MGLGTVMQTALTGMNAALQTPGFKASPALVATLPPGRPCFAGVPGVSLVIGGVRIAGFDFSQDSIDVADDRPALWTLEGEGLFILERCNADGELVTTEGLCVLGFQADADGRLDTSRLVALRAGSGWQEQSAGGGPVTLRRFSVSRDGRLLGHFSNGTRRVVGQLRLARFANPGGLAHRGAGMFRSTPASGVPQIVAPGSVGVADVIGGAVEPLNTDLGRELIDLALSGNQFRANLAGFTTADALLDELYYLTRQ